MSLGDTSLMTVAQVAKMFRVDSRTVRGWIKTGKIDIIRLPSNRIRILHSEVQRLFEESQWPPVDEDVS